MAAPAISTRYADTVFRSRLEARWALFFDYLGIAWEYEPEGYRLGPDRDHWYLPDFRLSEIGTWVEVKGDASRVNKETLAYAVHPEFGLPLVGDETMPRLLLLGELPRMQRGWAAPWHRLVATTSATFVMAEYAEYEKTAQYWEPNDAFSSAPWTPFPADSTWFTRETGAFWRAAGARCSLVPVGPSYNTAAFGPDHRVNWVHESPSWWGFGIWGGGPDAIGGDMDHAGVLAAVYSEARNARFDHGLTPARPRLAR